ncbi:MAG: neuraminidase-like domain-containing protein [Candidatus Sulfotelmatobacter sp.]
MTNLISVHLGAVDLTDTVLNNLKAGAPAQAFINDTLNSTLSSSLAGAATVAGYANLATLISAIPSVDIAANKDLSIHDFVAKEVKLPDDPAAKTSVEAAIAKLSTTTTVSDLLGLNSAINANPIFAGEVNKVDLAALLKTSPTLAANAQLIDDFVGQYAAASGSTAAFWSALSQNAEFKAAIPELQLALQLGTLTLDNPPLVTVLRTKYPQMTSPVTLATLSTSEWEQLITSQGVTIPESITGSTPAERVSNYAAAITGTLQKAFPGITFGSALQQSLAGSKLAMDRELAGVLSKASDLDILNTNLSTYIAQHGTTIFAGVANTDQTAVTERLATWQRVARVTSDFPTANSLLAAGYTSAYSIASTPRASFLHSVAATLGSTSAAEAIFGRAQQIGGTAMALYMNIRQGLTSTTLGAIGNVGGLLAQGLSAPTGIPNWQTLFGSLSSCTCSDCQSVYSASAYFVDLLQFLAKSAKNSAGQSPLDALLVRRPDLPYLKLNCVNTNTMLPYVDLVNEIMESFVVLNGTLNATTAHDTPKSATAGDLSVSPEYTLDAAYNTHLNSALFPPTLPFDRWLLTARTYLGFMGSSLYEVMETCQSAATPAVYSVPLATLPAISLPPFATYNTTTLSLNITGVMTVDAETALLALSSDASYTAAVTALYSASQKDVAAGTPSRIAIACEFLTISAAECVILTGATFAGSPPASSPSVWQYYGFPPSSSSPPGWEQTVAQVETFLQLMAIAYDDLVALLETRALNPTMSIMLQASGTDPCNLSKTTIVDLSTAGGTLQDSTLDHLHRFIRLWRKLGWAISDLDKTMTALGATAIDQEFLIELAAVQQLVTATGLPILSVLSFWETIDTDGQNSLYLSLFQNPAVLNPPDSAFRLNYVSPPATLPVLEFPSPLFPNMGYTTIFGIGLLALHGAMSDTEYAELTSVSTDASFLSAVASLHAAGVPGGTTMRLSVSPPGVVTLPSNPDPSLPSVTYDPVKRQISLTGAMSDDYRDLFNFSSDPAYQTAVDSIYEMRTLFGTGLASGSTISNHVYQIQAALRISSQDLAALLTYTELANSATPLNLANLSTLTRYALLAQGLGLTVSDLLTAIALIGTDPFVNESPAATLAFVETVQGIQSSVFTIAQLNYLYTNTYDPNAGIAPAPADIRLLLTTLQAGLSSIVNANAIVPDPKGALLAKALATLLGSSLANTAMGLITGTGVYSAPLAAMPSIVLPAFVSYNSATQTLSVVGAMTAAEEAQLFGLSTDPTYQQAVAALYQASQVGGVATYTQSLASLPAIGFPTPPPTIVYDAASQMLRMTGPMTSAEETVLLALSSDATYGAAVQNLHQQPIDFINMNLAAFLNASDAITQLIENPAQLSVAQKVAYVAAGLMPYLARIQSVSLIKQTLSDNLSLDPQLCDLLLNTILHSQVSPATATAMSDYLALVGDGLSASYYATVNLSGSPVATRIDASVDFNWGFGLPTVPVTGRPFSVRWTGYLMPQYSETYTFYVQSGDGMRLWINGVQLVNSWTDGMPTERSGTIALIAGQLYTIELDYYDHTASGIVELSWSSPSTPKAVIPQSQLFSGAVLTSLTPIVNSYVLLFKTNLLISTFRLTAADVSYLYSHGADFAGIDPGNPSVPPVPFDPNLLFNSASFTPAMFNEWQRLSAVVTLRNTLPGSDVGLLNVFATASASLTITPGTLSPAVSSAILQATNWNAADLAFLASSSAFGLSDADFKNEVGTQRAGLVQLQSCTSLLGRLGVSAQQLFTWSAFGPDAASEETNAKAIQSTVKAKYDDATWATVGKPLNDTIREASKEALIAYILANAAAWGMSAPDDGGPITLADQLYEYFLIDVNMSPCMLTSRIVQASAAVQLFVQRCLLNLESAVSPAVIDPVQWTWMQNFRVWQANRMVLLYPENWIVPTLRDDQTPLFQTFANALLQNPITEDNVEQAYLDYLNGLNTIARLDIRGCYWQSDAQSSPSPAGTQDATNDVLHVFGRTMNPPYSYFYRRLLNCSQYGQTGGGAIWTAWEPVGASIEGDHLIPVVWDGRLFLFWPSFVETAEVNNQGSMPIPKPGDGTYNSAPPKKDLTITLYWSEYQQGAWSPKQSSDPMTIEDFPGAFTKLKTPKGGLLQLDPYDLETSGFVFGAAPLSNDGLVITVYLGGFEITVGSNPSDYLFPVGQFNISQCGSSPSPLTLITTPPPASPKAVNVLAPADGVWYEFMVGPNLNESGLQVAIGLAPTTSPDVVPVLSAAVNKELGTPAKSYPYFELLFPQQFFPSFGLELPSSFAIPPLASGAASAIPGEPFFYQDSDRVYFVTETFSESSAVVRDASKASPVYALGTFTSASSAVDTSLVFSLTGTSPVGGTSVTKPPAAQPAATPARQKKEKLSLSQILFSNHFHPVSCPFIKLVNQYGLPGLLTLLNQQITKDGGRVSGFMLSPSATTTPQLTAGVLYAQGKVYAPTTPPNPGPASAGDFLYYNSSHGFYYNNGKVMPPYGQTDAPNYEGDAVIGVVDLNAGKVWETQSVSNGPLATLFGEIYQPTSIVNLNFPLEEVDFGATGAYSIYNWELFFHMPVLIATQLDQNQQFDDAETWWRYIFNPTTSSTDPIPQRYWQFLPFYDCSPSDAVFGQIQNIFYPPSGSTPPSGLCGQDIQDQINAWKDDPFNPFLIARMRPVAFRLYVVMQYCQHHLSYGDFLFAQNTRESINESTLHYVLVEELLGAQGLQIPERGTSQDYTYNDLVNLYGIDDFSNALVLLENDFPYLSTSGSAPGSGLGSALSMSSIIPYFCFPPNSTLSGLWSTVEDRLYKIRHCMNIQGVVEQLPLFSPPISPALLVAAEAAGVSLSSVLSNTNAGTPFYRFTAILQRALDLCSEVRALGAALLAAIEKQDAEALELLRATQEASLLQAMQQMKQYAVQDASATQASLNDSLALATAREQWYQSLVTNGLTPYENQYVTALQSANTFQQSSQGASQAATLAAMFPNLDLGVSGLGSPVATATFGGQQLAALATFQAKIYEAEAAQQTYQGTRAKTLGEWDRRNSEWAFQLAQAQQEIVQINDQITAAGFRVQIAQADQANLTLQIQNAQAVQSFLQSKYTNTELYSWMVDQISTVFFQCYQMAYDLATQAEVGFRFERGLTTSNYIQFGYWDSLKKGLLSGERLYADLKRMELAYLQTDVREYEITKAISLVLFDPWALINLKTTGQCIVNLPEAFFDHDYPGHYFRRIKTVSLAIPCVTGPYTSVNCTLTMLNSKVRVDNMASSRTDFANDAHFVTNYAATQSIATSTAQNDPGLFEVNFRDERYLPFEGAGAISSWQIDLPIDCNAFDFDSISDVVINLRYTSRYGGDGLRDLAKQAALLPTRPGQAYSGSTSPFATPQADLQRLFSLKHEFPSEWYKFLNPPDTATSQTMSIALGAERFPFQYRQKKIQISEVELLLVFKNAQFQTDYVGGGPLVLHLGPPGISSPPSATLTSSLSFLGGLAYGSIAQPPQPKAASAGSPPMWILDADNADITRINPALQNVVSTGGSSYAHLNPDAIGDVFLLCHYSVS